MPTVLRRAGFQVRIYPPPREHGPPHVHVWRAGGRVTIDLPDGPQPLRVRVVAGMREADLIAAIELVEENIEFLRAQWSMYHG